MKTLAIVAVSALVLAAGSAAAGTTYVVDGTSDPFLAGASSGNSVTFSGGSVDAAPAESPVTVAVTAGETLWIGATGLVSNCGCTLYGPNGGPDISSQGVTANGFTELAAGFTNLPINSLIGVFNSSATGNPIFEIGSEGVFTVPTGANTLYLATVDGFQWNNNIGSFSVSINPVPEPATWALMLVGLGSVGAGLRLSRRGAALA